MKHRVILSGGFPAVIAAAAFTLACPLISFAEETPAATDLKSALKVRVIESVEVKFPDRSIIYQRVAPPSPPPARPAAPVPPAKALSPAERAAAETRASKKFEVLMISATVYDHRMSELRWTVGGHEYRAWNNIDFNHLAALREIETGDSVYYLMMAIGNESAEAVEAANEKRKEMPPAERFSSKRSEYLLAGSEKETPPPEALAPMDALHTYYDANRERLAEESIQRETERTTREQWEKDHPPSPKDTVINFWPKKSRNYPTTAK